MRYATPVQVQASPPTQPALVEPATLVAMIERAARDQSVDIDKMERLMSMYERSASLEKERTFNDAMTAAQKEMQPIIADDYNEQTKSKYPSYAALDRAVRPIYTRHGFSLSFNTEPDAPELHVRVVCYVAACGHTRKYQADVPADGKGAKGGDVMTRTHAAQSAMTYGQRGLLKLIFNLAIDKSHDDDGNAAGSTQKYISDAQIEELTKLITDSGRTVARFCRFANIPSLGNIYASKYDAAVAAIRNAGKAKA